MRKVISFWVVSLLVTMVITHLLTVHFGPVTWKKNHADDNVDMVIVAGVPISQATPEMTEFYFRQKLFGEDMGFKSYPCCRYGTELGYKGVILSKQPLSLENPFKAMFQFW